MTRKNKKTQKKKINSKKKGNRTELKFAKILNERFNLKGGFKRVPMSGGWGTINKNEGVRGDAKEILSGDLICPTNFKFNIECKSRADFNFWDLINRGNNEIDEWIWQVEEEARMSNKLPLILVKVNNRRPFALLPKKLFPEGQISYKDYIIIRFDYLLQMDDDFFMN